MSEKRDVLPDRRRVMRFEFEFRGALYTADLGYYHDGRLGEVFLYAGKAGSALQIHMRDNAIALSFALQFGCTPEIIHRAFSRDSEGNPEGPLGYLFDRIVAEPALSRMPAIDPANLRDNRMKGDSR